MRVGETTCTSAVVYVRLTWSMWHERWNGTDAKRGLGNVNVRSRTHLRAYACGLKHVGNWRASVNSRPKTNVYRLDATRVKSEPWSKKRLRGILNKGIGSNGQTMFRFKTCCSNRVSLEANPRVTWVCQNKLMSKHFRQQEKMNRSMLRKINTNRRKIHNKDWERTSTELCVECV